MKGRQDEGSTLHFPFLRNETERGIANKEAGPTLEKPGRSAPHRWADNHENEINPKNINGRFSRRNQL
jgi:hypothetical protein